MFSESWGWVINSYINQLFQKLLLLTELIGTIQSCGIVVSSVAVALGYDFEEKSSLQFDDDVLGVCAGPDKL